MSINPEDYLGLVRTIAEIVSRTLPDSVQVEDLECAGYFGLMEAAKRYDPGRKTKFETYAQRRIRGAMLDELRKMDWVPRLVRQRGEDPIYMTNFSDFSSKFKQDGFDEDEEFVIEDNIEDIRDKTDVDTRLQKAISELKPKYAQAITLYYLQGYTLKESASYMKATESRVCQILKTALPILRKLLTEG